jgi:hypothetical protein
VINYCDGRPSNDLVGPEGGMSGAASPPIPIHSLAFAQRLKIWSMSPTLHESARRLRQHLRTAIHAQESDIVRDIVALIIWLLAGEQAAWRLANY